MEKLKLSRLKWLGLKMIIIKGGKIKVFKTVVIQIKVFDKLRKRHDQFRSYNDKD